jgi:hypothetical protein
MAGAEFLECPNCGRQIPVGAVRQPITSTRRAADPDGTPVFVVIDGDNWLLHRGSIAPDER